MLFDILPLGRSSEGRDKPLANLKYTRSQQQPICIGVLRPLAPPKGGVATSHLVFILCTYEYLLDPQTSRFLMLFDIPPKGRKCEGDEPQATSQPLVLSSASLVLLYPQHLNLRTTCTIS